MIRFAFVAAVVLAGALARPAGAQTPVPAPAPTGAPTPARDSAFVRQHYRKLDRQVPMRDGTKLYTVLYVPLDAAPNRHYPFLMTRTPYSAGPYGEENYRLRGPGPSRELSEEQYIFVYQDVRGRYQSEGQFEEMTPALPTADKARRHTPKGPQAPHDESTDTYDTIEWLLKNVPNNNGRVGIMGISYPGFYATASLPNAHPALKAVSPQAPVTDEFMGDDARHQGAFFLLDNFEFTNFFDVPRPQPLAKYDALFKTQPTDAYQFFLNLGPLQNANGPQYFNGRARIWNEYLQHDTYDAYWQARNIRPRLTGVRPAVLVVGGWFDAEDLFGALHTYKAIEQQNPGATNCLVMGPWTHGAWSRPDWTTFGPLDFGANTAKYYRQTLETPFFNHYLKDKGAFNPTEATVFNTGTNAWQTYPTWPPKAATGHTMFLQQNGSLATAKEAEILNALSSTESDLHIYRAPNFVKTRGYDEYLSDPAHPVPYTAGVSDGRNNQYMIEDQRFAAQRPDVLVFQTEPLAEDLTVAGPLGADLWVSTSGTDADFVVKLIDVLPADTPAPQPNPDELVMGGYQRLVRAEVMRGRFRQSFEHPTAFVPNQLTEVKYELPDVFHTFKKGHRLMIHVQSTWFPLVDRNPQQFLNISTAKAADFQKVTIRLYHDAAHPSGLTLPVVGP